MSGKVIMVVTENAQRVVKELSSSNNQIQVLTLGEGNKPAKGFVINFPRVKKPNR